jgi:hypothetical protein
MKLSLSLLPPLLVATASASSAFVLEGGDAHAAESPSDRARPAEALRVGVLGGVGFPRPLQIEGFARVHRFFGAGVEYGVAPAMTIDGVRGSLWSVAGDLRVFPLRGAFFVGVRAGMQHFDVSATIPMGPFGSMNGVLGVDTWFIEPRLGFLWVGPWGLSLGVDAGVQLPVATSESTNVPPWMMAAAPSGVTDSVNLLGRTALPTVDLLRVGVLF